MYMQASMQALSANHIYRALRYTTQIQCIFNGILQNPLPAVHTAVEHKSWIIPQVLPSTAIPGCIPIILRVFFKLGVINISQILRT